MVKKITSIVLASLLFLSTAGAADFNKTETAFTKNIVNETYLYMHNNGTYGLNKHDMLVFAKSSYRVAKMFPSYPSTSIEDRVKKFMSWGAQESQWHPNYVCVNVPGAKYATGKVKFFSVDYDWTGINSKNTKWAYYLALTIQQRKPLLKELHPEFRRMLADVRIPKKLKLKWIDPQLERDAAGQWKYLLRKGVAKDKIASRIRLEYVSNTEDDVDSMLIYRVLIEMDRAARGWKEGANRADLYRHLGNLDFGMQ